MSGSPLSVFSIEKLIGLDIPLFNVSLYLTNNSLYILIALASSMVLYTTINLPTANRLLPTNTSLVAESLFTSLLNMARTTSANQAFLPLLFTIFNTILLLNLISNIPYNYASTSALTFSLGLSLTVFIGVTILAISVKGWTFLATFVPAGTPAVLLPLLVVIELVSYCARAISLGVRLFANIVAGHTLLNIISTMSNKVMLSSYIGLIIIVVPVALLVALVGLEVAVSFIQAYVFVVLTAIYINEALRPL